MGSLKKIVLAIVALGLFWLIFLPLPKIERVKLQKQDIVYTSSEIGFEEMNSFLEVWSQYLGSRISKKGASKLSLRSGNFEDDLPLEVVRWLKRRHWDANRFFYVEQRLKATVKTAFMQEHISSNKKMLEFLKDEKNQEMSQNIENLISKQEQEVMAEKISTQEIQNVLPNLKVISEILDGKAVYRP